MATTNIIRELTVLGRGAWKDGSKVIYSVRSTKTAADGSIEVATYTVKIYATGSAHCNCLGFGFTGHCLHVDHFSAIEKERKEVKAIADARWLDRVVASVAGVRKGCATVDLFSLSQEELAARRIAGEKKQKQLKREYQARTVAQQHADREAAVLQPKAFSILRAS
jgi:hypothetical protein